MPDGRKANRGTKVRPGQYSAKQKLSYIEDYEHWADENQGGTVAEYVRHAGLPETFNKYLSKGTTGWRHPQAIQKYTTLVSLKLKQIVKAKRNFAKYPLAEAAVFKEVKERRTKGRMVSAKFLCVRMKQHMQEHYPEAAATFKASKGWRRAACRRWNFTKRKATSFRSSTIKEKLPDIQVYHKEMRILVQSGRQACPKYGRFKKHKRLSGDSVPLEFVQSIFNHTYEEVGTKKVLVKVPSDALRKRVATGHLTFGARPADKQPRGAIVFRGTGKRITKAERDAYHPKIAVLFQPKAWVDGDILEQITDILAEDEKRSYPESNDELLWLGDNLQCQTTGRYKKQMKEKLNGIVKNYPPNCSDKGVAPVDNGLGDLWKSRIGVNQDAWLDDDDNIAKWESNDMTASERRVLLTHWAGEALEWCYQQESLMARYMEKAGALMTANGSDDEKMKLEGLPDNYKYEFMHVDVDEHPDSAGEHEAVYGEEPAPDHDIVELEIEDEYEGISTNAAELELPDEDPTIPAGWTAAAVCPAVTDHKWMLKQRIMFKWDSGWAQGAITRRHTRGTEYNYFVKYDEGNGTMLQYRQGLFASGYFNAETNETGHWLLLVPNQQ